MKKRILPFFCLVIISGFSVPAFAQLADPGISPDEIDLNSVMIHPFVFTRNNAASNTVNARFALQSLRRYSFHRQGNDITAAHKINNQIQQYMSAGFGTEKTDGISADFLDDLNIGYSSLQSTQSYPGP